MVIKLNIGTNDPVIRQSYHNSGSWDGVTFNINDDSNECDYWVVLETTPKHRESVICRSGHVLFAPLEPPSIRTYHPDFLSQFSGLLSFRSDLQHPLLFSQHPLIPWWIGLEGGHEAKRVVKNYEDLERAVPEKNRTLSAFCSARALTVGHQERISFIRQLKAHFRDKLHVFGLDAPPCNDKWEGIAPYKYHIAVENSQYRDYWTEKVADTFLGGAFLIYDGCPNLSDYYPGDSFCHVDRGQPRKAIETIERLLHEDAYTLSLKAIATARTLVLRKYNLFPALIASVNLIIPKLSAIRKIRHEHYFQTPILRRARTHILDLIRGK